MSLVEKLKEKKLELRKAKIKGEDVGAQLDDLTYVMDQADKAVLAQKSEAREPTDAQYIQEIKKFVNASKEVIKDMETCSFGNPCTNLMLTKKSQASIDFVSQFLPEQMTDTEIRSYVEKLIDSAPDANMGLIMKSLKFDHEGHYDGRTASTIIKEILKK